MSDRWTEAQTERLKILHAEGLSFSAISAELGAGFSRSACVGKAMRLKLPARNHHRTNKAKVSIIRLRKAVPTRQIEFEQFKCDPIPLLELKPNQCRWPIGEGREILFCAAPKYESYSYCGYHCMRAFKPAESAAAA